LVDFEIGRDVAGRVHLCLLTIDGVSVRERDAAFEAEWPVERCARCHRRDADSGLRRGAGKRRIL
jgi:hypothetical protein